MCVVWAVLNSALRSLRSEVEIEKLVDEKKSERAT